MHKLEPNYLTIVDRVKFLHVGEFLLDVFEKRFFHLVQLFQVLLTHVGEQERRDSR